MKKQHFLQICKKKKKKKGRQYIFLKYLKKLCSFHLYNEKDEIMMGKQISYLFDKVGEKDTLNIADKVVNLDNHNNNKVRVPD